MPSPLTGIDDVRASGHDSWARSRQAEEQAAGTAADSRETRMDLQRRHEVLERQAAAMSAHESAGGGGAPRVVLALRQEWLAGRVRDALVATGVDVRACVVDGADAVGICVAEQPDLLVVEDVLQRMNGTEVLAETTRFSPGTAVLVQVASAAVGEAFLAAGARATVARGSSPDAVAGAVRGLLDAAVPA